MMAKNNPRQIFFDDDLGDAPDICHHTLLREYLFLFCDNFFIKSARAQRAPPPSPPPRW
jgi:hypothetical protein